MFFLAFCVPSNFCLKFDILYKVVQTNEIVFLPGNGHATHSARPSVGIFLVGLGLRDFLFDVATLSAPEASNSCKDTLCLYWKMDYKSNAYLILVLSLIFV